MDRAGEAGVPVGVDDRLQRPPFVLGIDDPGQGPLHEPVAGRVGPFLVGRPGREHDDAHQGGHRQPASIRHPPQGAEDQERQDPEDARAVAHHRQAAQDREQGGAPEARPHLLPERGEDEGGCRQEHRRGQELRPHVEAVENRQAAEQEGDDRQGAGDATDPRRDQQRPGADDPELLQHQREHLVVEGGLVPGEGSLGEHVADLERRPVAGEPVAEERRRPRVAVVEEPVRVEVGNPVVGDRRSGEAVTGEAEGVGGAAVDEAEEEEEGRAQRPERDGREQAGRQTAIEAAGRPEPGDPGDRADGDQVGEGFARQAVPVVGPEGQQGGDAACRHPHRQHQRQSAGAAIGRPEGGRRQRQAGEHEVDGQGEKQFALHGGEGWHTGCRRRPAPVRSSGRR